MSRLRSYRRLFRESVTSLEPGTSFTLRHFEADFQPFLKEALRMIRKVLYPIAAVATLGLAFSFNGCSCQANLGGDAQAKAPPPPAADPAPAPPPPPPAAMPNLATSGKASMEGDQVKIPGAIEFDVDKSSIRETAKSKEILTTLLDFMNKNKNVTKLRIEGHTDNTGGPDHNQTLSQGRADAVAKWLGDHGVDKGRLLAKGFGENKPLNANDTAENKQKNRRTEFHVEEIDGKAVSSNMPAK
jgi:outer membrane protein OmpA-like peptidoglycan-associated protein